MISALLALILAVGPADAPLDAEVVARRQLLAETGTSGLSSQEVADMEVQRRYRNRGTGVTLLWLRQTADGVPVDRATARFAVTADGRVAWSSSTGLAPGVRPLGAHRLSAIEAVARAAADRGIELGGPATIAEAGPTRRVEVRAAGLVEPAVVEAVWLRSGRPGWWVQIRQRAPFAAWLVLIDAVSGRALERLDLVHNVQDGMVFAGGYPSTFPGGVPRTLASFGTTLESPAGWLLSPPAPLARNSVGNNADVGTDWDATGVIATRADGGVLQEFRFPFLDSWATLGDFAADEAASITNVFYWVNRWHDQTYALGFDEAAGNAQALNFGLGGVEGDPVIALVDYGALAGVRNNANSTVGVDGTSPIVRLFLFESGFPRRDSAFDPDIMFHELSHILILRSVGESCFGFGAEESGALLEGTADFLSMAELGSPVLGEYVTGDLVNGIRNYAAGANPRTYCDRCDLGGCQVHNDGEILASTLWTLYVRLGPTMAKQLVVDALQLTSCLPTFLDLRAALISADELRFGGVHVCDIWTAFTERGMGFAALAGGREDCDLTFAPPRCSGEAFLRLGAHTWSDVAGGDGDGLASSGETLAVSIDLSNLDGASVASAVSGTLRSLTAGVTVVDAAGSWPDIAMAGVATNLLPLGIALGPDYVCGSPIVLELEFSWAPGRLRSESFALDATARDGSRLFAEDLEGASPSFIPGGEAAVSTAQNHTPGGTQSVHMLAGCYAGDTTGCSEACDDLCSTLTSPELALPPELASLLRFWARYNIEVGFDGLAVQVSTDGGSSWQTAPIEGGFVVAGSGLNGCELESGAQVLNGPPGNPGLTDWTEVRADLGRWAGQSVRLRVALHQDSCVSFEGAYVDDVELLVRHCQEAPFVRLHALTAAFDDGVDASCSDRDGIPDPGESVRLDADIVNIGNAVAPSAVSTLISGNPNVLGLPDPALLGDLGPGLPTAASFSFSVRPSPFTGCFEDAALELEHTSALPSASIQPLVTELRGDALPRSYRDSFDGGRAAWIAALGPDGSVADWSLQTLDCRPEAGRFWTVARGIDPAVCGTGEPDYSSDSDSLLTSPPIDLGAPGARLVSLSWMSPLVLTVSVADGFTQVLVDHDDDGLFTPVMTMEGGFGAFPPGTSTFSVDLLSPADGTPLLPSDTARFVRVQLRFRARAPDPGPTADSTGWHVDDFELSWLDCPDMDCRLCDRAASFDGLASATDLDVCAATGIRLDWAPASFGAAGGSYDIQRDGLTIASALAPPYVDLPGDPVPHLYQVLAVTADCGEPDGNTILLEATDRAGTPPPLGNVLKALKTSPGVTLSWDPEPAATAYAAARSALRDFGAPLAPLGSVPAGTLSLVDPTPPPGVLHTYRVAQEQCGMLSPY